MKKIVFVAGLALLLATSCSKETVNEVINNNQEVADRDTLVPVHVYVNGFNIIQEDFPETRSTPQTPADYSGVKGMTLAFYTSDGTEKEKVTQLKGSLAEGETFGEFSCYLPMGSYTMVVLGYGYFEGDELSLTSPTQAVYTSDHTRETFATTQAVNITNTDAVNLSVTINRIVSRLQVISSDGRTENAKSLRMTLSAGGKAFNPTTGRATSNTGFSNTVSVSASVGATSNSATYIFLDSDEQTMDVTIDVLDEDNNSISQKVVQNVPFKRNSNTKITGNLYSAGVSSTFLLDTEWGKETSLTF